MNGSAPHEPLKSIWSRFRILYYAHYAQKENVVSGLLILGMHRSGTSCLTGCLQAAGLKLGPVNTKAAFNKKGNREHERIRDFHEELLQRDGFSWNSPPDHQLPFRDEDKRKFIALIDEFRSGSNWGVKDPRAVFFANSWQRLTGCRFVGTYRHPEEVAASLMARSTKWGHEMSKNEALELWRKYNNEILNLFENYKFPMIRYGAPSEHYVKRISHIADSLDLVADKAGSFFEKELTHQINLSDTVPDHCKAIWDRLLSAEDTSLGPLANR